MRRVSLLWGALTAVCSLQPQPAQATIITARLCSDPDCNPNAGHLLDFQQLSNGVGTLLSNRYTLFPFVFNDASANFSGTMLAVDSQGEFVYLWGGGVGTNKTGAQLWLDIEFIQLYQTSYVNTAFSAFSSGSCNAAATAAGDGVTTTLGPSWAAYVVLNAACSPFNLTGGPVGLGFSDETFFFGDALFKFNAGSTNQQVNVNWGWDFPDPAITTFPDPNNLPAGFTQQIPEPASFLLVSSGLLVLGLLRRASRARLR